MKTEEEIRKSISDIQKRVNTLNDNKVADHLEIFFWNNKLKTLKEVLE